MICADVCQKIKTSDSSNSPTLGTINELAALQNILHFLSVGSNGQSAADTTASKTDKLEVVPEPMRALLATLVCDFANFSTVYTDPNYFKNLLIFVNTKLVSFHLSFVPKQVESLIK